MAEVLAGVDLSCGLALERRGTSVVAEMETVWRSAARRARSTAAKV